MSNKLIGYDNALWRVEQEFSYTGEDQPFTLQPGEYLFICEGARGGKGRRDQHEYGAITFGEITLNETTTFHAVVGQDGGDCSTDDARAGYGGFNGGGHGGLHTNAASGYYHGAGGGGATDIRLLPYDENEYPTRGWWGDTDDDPANATLTMADFCEEDDTVYPELPDDGYERIDRLYISSNNFLDLGYTISQDVNELTIMMDLMWLDYSEHHLFDYHGSSVVGAFSFEIKSFQLYGWMITPSSSSTTYTQISSFPLMAYQRHHLRFHIKSPTIEIYDNDVLIGTLNGASPSSDSRLHLHLGRYNNNTLGFLGLVHRFQVMEDNTTVIDLLPCKHSYMDGDISKTDYGFYDVIRQLDFVQKNAQSYFEPSLYVPLEYVQAWATSSTTAYHSAEINTYYIPKPNTKVTMDVVCFWEGVTSNAAKTQQLFGCGTNTSETAGSKQFTFGIRYTNSTTDYQYAYYARDGQLSKTNEFDYHERLHIECFEREARIYQNDTLLQTIEVPDAGLDTATIPMYIGSIAYGTSVTSPSKQTSYVNFQVYEMTISEIDENHNETVMRHFIPAKQGVNSESIGLYDTVHHIFMQGTLWKPGPRRMEHPIIQNSQSLHSRIMVAAGAGGGIMTTQASSINYLQQDGISYGGGAYGTRSSQSNNSYTSYNSQTNYNRYLYPTQSSGYMFGYGQTATNASSDTIHGSSGAGGGWYGGFANTPYVTSNTYTEEAGGGGSSYVLTAQSYKPTQYIPNEKYYFTHVQMHAGLAMGDLFAENNASHEWENGHIYICKRSSMQKNDIVVYPCTGSVMSHVLPPGKYRIKVWGGDSGSRCYMSNCAKGGFSQGVLETSDTHTLFVHVGGSGGPYPSIGNDETSKTNIAITNCPSHMHNGGAAMTDVPSSIYSFPSTMYDMSGGGSDVRIDVDDDLHRIIVAGGAGSEGALGTIGGFGGGTSGGDANGTIGTNNGPGTQLEGFAFGYGESGKYYSAGYGGSGGGGWYGGHGTTPNGSGDNDKSGAGGSGYILTATSNKPTGYGCDNPEVYMTEESTIQGGNTLPLWHTKISIECLEIASKCLCQDAEGYKYLTEDTSVDPPVKRWTLLESQTITPETFATYGSGFQTDNGLLNKYKILCYAENDNVDAIDLCVIPNQQTIHVDIDNSVSILNCVIDDIYNAASFTRYCNIKRNDESNTIEIQVDHVLNDNKIYKAYQLNLNIANKAVSNDYVKLDENGNRIFKHYYFDIDNPENLIVEERTMERKNPEDYRGADGSIQVAQWLLPVGSNYNIPVEYYKGTLSNDTSYYWNLVLCEYERVLYMASVHDSTTESGSFITINTMNLIDHTTYRVHRFQLADVYPQSDAGGIYLGPMLMDEKYFYFNLSQSNSNVSPSKYAQCLVRINRETFSVFVTTSCDDETFIGNGWMEWWDEHTIICLGQKSILLYDTIANMWTKYPHALNGTSNATVTDWTVGNTQIIEVGTNSNNKNVSIIDKETFTLIKTIQLANAAEPPCVCHDGDHTFYIVTKYYIYAYDETTSTIVKTINIGSMEYPENVRYCNSSVIISQCKGKRELFIYRTDVKQYDVSGNEIPAFIIVYLPWSHNNNYKIPGSCYLPLVVGDVYYYGHATLLSIPYSGYEKYKFGPKTNKQTIVLNASNADIIHCDDRFVSLLPSGIQVHEGYMRYMLEESSMEHVCLSEVISKSDYRYLLPKSKAILKEG
jgi:hypothetical protein